jgi:hypothetical protein
MVQDWEYEQKCKLESEIAELEKQAITDADIEAWALKESIMDMQPRRYISASQVAFRNGCERGAKAMRNGEIRHIEEQEKRIPGVFDREDG